MIGEGHVILLTAGQMMVATVIWVHAVPNAIVGKNVLAAVYIIVGVLQREIIIANLAVLPMAPMLPQQANVVILGIRQLNNVMHLVPVLPAVLPGHLARPAITERLITIIVIALLTQEVPIMILLAVLYVVLVLPAVLLGPVVLPVITERLITIIAIVLLTQEVPIMILLAVLYALLSPQWLPTTPIPSQ